MGGAAATGALDSVVVGTGVVKDIFGAGVLVVFWYVRHTGTHTRIRTGQVARLGGASDVTRSRLAC